MEVHGMQEVRLLKGRLSVVKQIFQFLPGLKSFVGVIENARQLVKCNDTETDNIPYDLTVQSMNMSVPSLASIWNDRLSIQYTCMRERKNYAIT
jgi:hypothetical protein